MYEQSRSYVVCHLAGFAHWDGVEAFNELKVGLPLSLQVEPENPYDPQAVAVYFNERKIGYIPSKHNSQLSPFLLFGHVDLFEAFINRVSPESHPEGQIGIVVKIVDERTEERICG
jgi:hypothetical protein